MRKMMAGCLLILMSLGAGMDVAAQSGAKDEAKKAGEATKEAGKDTADAAKHVAKATKKGAKKGARAVKKAVTGDAHATCVDGTRQAGTTEEAAAAACSTHGGVAKH
jgi:hypothetical protein